jgi:hypothetical protein
MWPSFLGDNCSKNAGCGPEGMRGSGAAHAVQGRVSSQLPRPIYLLQAYFMSAPSGLGALAENQIRAGMKEGLLDNLKGKGAVKASPEASLV